MLDAPEEMYAPEPVRRRPRRVDPEAFPGTGRDFDDDFAGGLPDRAEEGRAARGPRGGVRFRFNGRAVRLPKTLWGRVFSATAVLLFFAVLGVGLLAVRSFFLHDPRFVVESFSSIESTGNIHVTRTQLLSIFGEDVERNIFTIPLPERRAELEQLPWVEHASIMRLLPNHIRVLITERTPVALVRQGTQLSMVDANGVLLDIPADTPADPHYSFPVITAGIAAGDPLSTRAARMKIFTQFMSELDGTSENISKKISEVDLANPEDVKALLFEGSSDVLVHFGDSDFLARYRKFAQHLAEWRTQYPKLSSVDMRYDRQVVLDMQPGSEVPTQPAIKAPADLKAKAAGQPAAKAVSPATPRTGKAAPKILGRPITKSANTAQKTRSASLSEWHMVVVKPHTKEAAALAAKMKSARAPQASPR